MERKFANNPPLQQEYIEFMRAYQELGHMTPVPDYQGPWNKVCYLPHHAVFKQSSSTTKTRVVFDASCQSTSGVSLNHLLLTGPKIQDDLHAILIRWRKYPIAWTADMEKMFRQIELHADDRNFHRILWREKHQDRIQEYQLNTVTYGTAPATFLAVRAMHQLVKDDGAKFPRASKAILNDFYVDDLLSGAYSINEAKETINEIMALMQLGCFNLRKWCSNSPELLNHIPLDLQETQQIEITEDKNSTNTLKPLGILWDPHTDLFQFKISMDRFGPTTDAIIKRKILSDLSSVFDPTGWLAPVILNGKIIMQMLWKEKTDWDEIPSETVRKRWLDFQTHLPALDVIKIPRWTHLTPAAHVEIHGFSDSSEKAFAACIYMRVQIGTQCNVTLLNAKTRVAPLKGKITLPRLELCGATLL
ncbi:uncharacterized protein DMENIID0001_161430 [Sergentomyia squamirostris]